MEKDEARVFFVTDSTEDNEEIFETLQEATAHWATLDQKHKPRLYVAIVRHAYLQDYNGPNTDKWNYDDLGDTFQLIGIIVQ